MIYIGIDPGLTGAVAVVTTIGEVAIFDTPITKIKQGKTLKSDYLPYEMADILERYRDNGHVFIEKVHAMPAMSIGKDGKEKRQGVTSLFRFGEGYGLWLGIIAALHIPMTKVAPQTWKKSLLFGMPDKDSSRQRAQELWPKCVNELSRKKDIGRSDALLIATWGMRTFIENKE